MPYGAPRAPQGAQPSSPLHSDPAVNLDPLPRGKHLDVWETFAREVGGTWHAPVGDAPPRIEIAHAFGGLSITGNVSMVLAGNVLMPVITTTFSVLLPATHAQRFSVSRASFASAVANWFGALDIHVDDDAFDEAFVLRGESPDLVRALFASAPLRERYLRDFEGELHRRDDRTIHGDPTPDADPFELTVPGYVDTAKRMRALWELYIETLASLPDAVARGV